MKSNKMAGPQPSQQKAAHGPVASDKEQNSLFRLNDQMSHELRLFFNKK